MNPFNHTLHKELWNELAEHPELIRQHVIENMPKEKRDALGHYRCAACQYTIDNFGKLKCTECPFNLERDWNWSPVNCLDGLYSKWLSSYSQERKECAAQIRDLPVRPGVPTD